MAKVSIVLVDDHQLIRDGLRSIISSNSSFEIIAEANNGKELLSQLEVITPDVVLLDVDMPILDGLEVLTRLSNADKAKTKFVMLTMHGERGIIQKAIELGVSGFLLKSISKEMLIEAIEKVSAGQEYYSPELLKTLSKNEHPNESPLFELFTPKEKYVANKILNGLHTKEIAKQMRISVRTVETHKANLMKKAQVTHLAELIHVLNTSK